MRITLNQHDIGVAIAEFIFQRSSFDSDDSSTVITIEGIDDTLVAHVEFIPDEREEDEDPVVDDPETEAEEAVEAAPKKRRRRRSKATEPVEAEAPVEAATEPDQEEPVEEAEKPQFTPDKEVPIAAAEPEEAIQEDPSFTESAQTAGSDSSAPWEEKNTADIAQSQTEPSKSAIFPNIGSSAPDLTPEPGPEVAAKSLFANLTRPTA